MDIHKIYKEDNYIVITNTITQNTHYGFAKDVFVDKSYNNKAIYRFFNVKEFNDKAPLLITQIVKADGSAYTANEFETFYKTNTGGTSSGGGGGGGGDASAANQVTGNAKLTSIDNKVATETTLAAIKAKTDNLDVLLSTRTGSGDTQPITATTLPLPTGASTSSLQTTGNNSLSSIDGKTPALSSGKVPVTDPTSLPLPTGASTSSNQTTANNSLASIDTKTPTLSSGKVPVTDPTTLPLPSGASTSANQTSTNTKLDQLHTDLTAATPTGTNSIGQVTANAGTNLNTSALNLETTQALIKAKTDNLDVALSTLASASNQVASSSLLTTISTNGFISTANSTSSTLGISGVFTGTAEEVTQYGFIDVAVFSNVASATNGLSVQQSTDNTNWDIQDTYTIPASIGKTFSVPRTARYFRVVYTNGGTIQASFRLQVVFTKYGVKSSSVKPQDLRSNDNDMEEVISYGMSYDPTSDTWSRIQTNDLSITGQGTQTAVGQNIVLSTTGTATTDSIGYRMISIQVVPTGTVSSGVVTFEGSNDNVTFVPVLLYDDASATANPASTVSPATGVSRYFSGTLHFRYFRARISTIIGGGGSLQAFTVLRQTSFQPNIYTIAQATAANLNATIGSGTLTSVTTVTTLANGQTAHSAAVTGSPLRTSGKVAPITIATQDTTLVAGDASDIGMTTALQQIIKTNAPSELDYNFMFSTVGTVVTPQTLVQASGTASIRSYVKSLRISTDTLGVAGSAFILDGALTVSSIAITTGLTTTSTSHDLKIGDAVIFTALSAGTGVSTNTVYFVTSVGSATTFNFALTAGGSNVVPSIAYTGTTVYRALEQIRLQTVALVPTEFTYEEPIRTNTNTALNFFIPTSFVTGNIYLTVNGYRGF